MTFSELVADARYLSRSTSASYDIIALTRNINIAYNDVSRLIWENTDKWQFDDSNASGLPIAQADLVHGQQDYELPSTAQRIYRVEVLDSNGNYIKVDPLDQSDIQTMSMDEYLETAGLPVYYDLMGRSVLLYPKPSSAYCTTTDGLQIYVDRDVDEFATTATTTTPGFAKQFHRILSYAAAIDFLDDSSLKDRYLGMKAQLEDGLKRFYGHRNQELRTIIRPKNKRFWSQYK